MTQFLPPPTGKGSAHSRELTGTRFGRLVALGRIALTPTKGFVWLCDCDCGNQAEVVTNSLTSGNTRSCGCLGREQGRNNWAKYRQEKHHKQSHTRLHDAWCSIKGRCHCETNPRWSYYGGRGIAVCTAWREDYLTFANDMGEPPINTSIDRINNEGNYSCGKCDECTANGWTANCRWATPIEQANNKRNNRHFTFNEETLTLAQWSRRIGLNSATLSRRIDSGWSMEKALTTPPRNGKNRARFLGL